MKIPKFYQLDFTHGAFAAKSDTACRFLVVQLFDATAHNDIFLKPVVKIIFYEKPAIFAKMAMPFSS